MVYIAAFLVFVALAGVGFAFSGDPGTDKAAQRAKQLGSEKRKAKAEHNERNARRKQTQQMLDKLRAENSDRRRLGVSQDIESRLIQAGLDMAPQNFWIICGILAFISAGVVLHFGIEGPPPVMGVEIKSQIAMMVLAAVAGGFFLPRWFLGFLAKGRREKMVNQFADSIDIIVRGVKSGLPLAECFSLISQETPEPLGSEFGKLCDNLQIGTTLEHSLQQFYKYAPLSEVNFFVIVLTIQSKTGGNLSETLGNLSTVIRARKMMREKIKALSSEAKASAMIIGCLPFAVGFMVYMTTPAYIMELFTNQTGHTILFVASALMITGITVMRKMINLDI